MVTVLVPLDARFDKQEADLHTYLLCIDSKGADTELCGIKIWVTVQVTAVMTHHLGCAEISFS